MDIEIKRAELQTKYNNWIKKNTRRLVVAFIAYIVIILINFFTIKKNLRSLFFLVSYFSHIQFMYYH